MRKVKMDMYTKYFLLKRRTTITLSVWLLMGLLGAFLEAASSTNGSWIIGVFNDPLASLPGLNQRFLFYSFRISGLIYLCIFGHYYISGFRKIDISQTNLSEEYIRRNSIVARYLVTIMGTLSFSTMFTFFYSYFVLPSPRTVGEALRNVWLNEKGSLIFYVGLVAAFGLCVFTFGYMIVAEIRDHRNLPPHPNLWKKMYQIIIPEKYYSYEQANIKNHRRISLFFFAFVVLVKSIFYFVYPGVDKITLGGFLVTVLIASVFFLGAGLLPGIIPYFVCIVLRRKPETTLTITYIFWALGVLYLLYLNFKENHPDSFL